MLEGLRRGPVMNIQKVSQAESDEDVSHLSLGFKMSNAGARMYHNTTIHLTKEDLTGLPELKDIEFKTLMEDLTLLPKLVKAAHKEATGVAPTTEDDKFQ